MVGRWSVFLADRYIMARRNEKSNTTQKLSILGLAAGVITLVAVMSIMNGLQMGFINDILEIESYHIRITGVDDKKSVDEILDSISQVKSYTVFTDIQTLLRGRSSSLEPVVVRLIDKRQASKDSGFLSHLGIQAGEFLKGGDRSAVIGTELSRFLHVFEGDKITLVSMAGKAFASLRPETIDLETGAVFKSGYYEFDRGMIFISDQYFPLLDPGNGEKEKTVGIKLKNRYRDMEVIAELNKKLPGAAVVSWRKYNKSFFSALRIEKITMLFLIALIFIVIGVNIYNSIKRTVAEKLEDIAVLYALGAPEKSVRMIFLIEGLIVGVTGGLAGIAIGLVIVVNINELFLAAGTVIDFFVRTAGIMVSAAGLGDFRQITLFPEDYFYLEGIPVKVLLPELVMIFVFSLLSSFASAYYASKKLSVKTPAEYLRYE